MSGRPTIAVDFDGTLAVEDQDGALWPVAGAKEALAALKATGVRIVIHTCRTGIAQQAGRLANEVADIRDFLDANGLLYDEIHLGEKLVADVYVDDRAVAFDGDWRRARESVVRKIRRKA